MATGDIKVIREESGSWSEVNAADYLLSFGTATKGDIVLGENTSIAYDPAGSADGKYSGETITGTAGAVIAFGELIQLSNADGRWEKCRPDVAAGAVGDCRGLVGICAVKADADGDPIKVLLKGTIRADSLFPSLTVGKQVFSGTAAAGAVTSTAPTTSGYVQRVVGFALTADEIFFNPSPNYTTVT